MASQHSEVSDIVILNRLLVRGGVREMRKGNLNVTYGSKNIVLLNPWPRTLDRGRLNNKVTGFRQIRDRNCNIWQTKRGSNVRYGRLIRGSNVTYGRMIRGNKVTYGSKNIVLLNP